MKSSSMYDIEKLLTVIIRSVGERTESLCYQLIREQVAEDNITIIGEIPFIKTLEKVYAHALMKSKKWTLCVDADVLIKAGSIAELVNFAEKQSEDVYEVQAVAIDKFLTFSREVGVRLYRTALMDRGMPFFDEAGDSIRPESFLISKVLDQGFDQVHTEIMMGLHDFEQSNEDIYRKCFVHSIKHANCFKMDEIYKLWDAYSNVDDDFKIAIAAKKKALSSNEKVLIDKRADFMGEYLQVAKELAVVDKDVLEFDKTDIWVKYNSILFDFLGRNVMLGRCNSFYLR